MNPDLIGASLTWKRVENGWRLFDGSRRFGDVVPDGKHPGMWRRVLSGNRLTDMANLSRAKSAVLEAAERELAYEARSEPRNAQQSGAVFEHQTAYSACRAGGSL